MKISKEKLIEIAEIVIYILLLLWIIMPVLQTFRIVDETIKLNKWYFILMRTIGVVGIVLSIFNIYHKIKDSENKKKTLKELLPIFIFVIYMIWTLFSSLKAARRQQAFNGNFYRKEGYYMYINYAGYFLCAFLLENKTFRKVLLNTFLAVSIFLIIISRVTLGGEIYSEYFMNNRVEESVFFQFNHYGYYLTMALICSLGLFMQEKNKVLKIIYAFAYAIIGYALIYNNTFGCYLAVCIFFVLYAIYALIKKTDRKVFFIAVAIFTILSCITFKDGKNLAYENLKDFAFDIKSVIVKIMNLDVEDEEIEKNFEEAGTYRMELWINGLKFISKKPIIGYGPDNLKDEYLKNGIDQDRPHNLLIYLACVSGIPGMVLYVTAVGIIVIKGIRNMFSNDKNGQIYLIVVITYLISSMFGNSMYYTSPYFFIFLGSLMHYNLNRKKVNQKVLKKFAKFVNQW